MNAANSLRVSGIKGWKKGWCRRCCKWWIQGTGKPCKCLGDASVHRPGQYQPGCLCGTSGRVSPCRQAWPSSHITRWWWQDGQKLCSAKTYKHAQHLCSQMPPPHKHKSSLHLNLLTWFSPPPSHLTSLPLCLSLSLSDSPGIVKSSELSRGMSDRKHTKAPNIVPHTQILILSFAPLFFLSRFDTLYHR